LLSEAKFPLRLADKLLLVTGACVLGVALTFFAVSPTSTEQVVTETLTTSRVITETRSATWSTTETKTSTVTSITVSLTTQMMTTYSTLTQTVTSIYAWGTVYNTYYVPIVVTYASVSEVKVTHTSLVRTTETQWKTTYSVMTSTQKSDIQSTYTHRVFQPALIARTLFQTAIWIAIGMVVLGLTYRRINEYRTRLHIYYEILKYVSESPRIASHIMRRCNLETGKFNKYINELQTKGFVNLVQRDDAKQFVATEKSFEYLRDEKLARFIDELS